MKARCQVSKNTRWSTDDFKKAGLIEVGGEFVKSSSQVTKGKVDKLPNLLERAIGDVCVSCGGTGWVDHVFTQIESDKSDIPSKEPCPVCRAIQLPPDYLNTKHGIGIVTASVTTSIESLLPLIDKMQKNFIKTSEKHLKDIVKAEQDRAADPNRPYVHYESDDVVLPTGERVYIKHRFDIDPCAAPRMTRKDKYYLDPNHSDPKKRQRKAVTKYFGWKITFTLLAKQQGYSLTEVLRVIFIIPMPAGLSEKEKNARRGHKHQIRPDTDNYTKALKDSFGLDDGHVWDERSIKVWGDKGQILIF